MYEIGPQAIEVFTSGVGIPIKAGYCIAVMSYTLMKGCPVSARMGYAGGPFLLKGLRVLGHMLFIDDSLFARGFILDKY